MGERVIRTHADIGEGAGHLARACPRMRHAIRSVGRIPLRRRAGGFEQLLGAIVSQQLSVASADAIWSRLSEAGFVDSGRLAAASDAALRKTGLSRQKIRYARELAAAPINYRSLGRRPTPEVVGILTQVPGIGVWTAEIYAMFSLGRADAFAAGDLALQEAARMLYDLSERPSERELRDMAAPWSPWRAVAARILWAYYRAVRNREGVR